MPRVKTWLASPASEGPIELFPDPAQLFEDWNDELAARLVPVARFDLALLGEAGLAGAGLFLYYEDVQCSFLSWSVRDGKIVDLDPRWRQLRPLREQPSRTARAAVAGGTHARFDAYEVEVPAVSQIGKHQWAGQFERALREAGARSPLGRLRLGGHPCYVQADGYVDDDTFVLAELPTSWLELDPMYLYLFGDGTEFSQTMQMT